MKSGEVEVWRSVTLIGALALVMDGRLNDDGNDKDDRVENDGDKDGERRLSGGYGNFDRLPAPFARRFLFADLDAVEAARHGTSSAIFPPIADNDDQYEHVADECDEPTKE